MQKYIDGTYLMHWLLEQGMGDKPAMWTKITIMVTAIALLSVLANYVAKKIILVIVRRIVKKSKTTWDDILLRRKVFSNLSHFAPALVIFYTIHYAIPEFPRIIEIIQSGTYVYMIAITTLVINSFINGLHEIYQTLEVSKTRSIKGYIQVVRIIIYFLAAIVVLSIILDKDLGYFFTGLGAMAAILMLVFKDSILGLVSGIQLSANDMVRVGDWISMPSHNADGDVIDITLNTVKVQNWDKTIATIPTYALISESFSNWRGMMEAGGRRIKRHINIDMKSVKFCDDKLIEKFKKIHYIKDYVKNRQDEVVKYNKENKVDETVLVNGRRLTNLGTFRKYVEAYLKNHPLIHQEMTFLVRQLQPSEIGIPIEIYVFSKDQAWANYEGIQADIFDHILAVLPEFDLHVYQNPTGDDFQKLTQ